MIATIEEKGQRWRVDLGQPLDISLPLYADGRGVNCFYAPLFEVSPVVAGSFIGSTQAGGLVNFMNVRINPHGNGTHTECVGHIAREVYTINQQLRNFHHLTRLLTVYPERQDNGDRVITYDQLAEVLLPGETSAVVIRTAPNDGYKKSANYSGANPPYLHHKAATLLVEFGVEHLLLDLPSVDREEDGGELLAHKAFWQYPWSPRTEATITELVYVENNIPDGLYLLSLQIASFEIDVSPSKPVLYSLMPDNA